MIAFFIILIAATVVCVRKRTAEDGVWCNKSETDTVKGFFICWVIISHSTMFIPPEASNWAVKSARFINGGMGQLVVVPFLFFSGYGVAESIRRKGMDYVKLMPVNRILPTILNFDVAVLVFAALHLFYTGSPPLNKFFQALVDWTTIGQPNWYIFVIVGCYLLAFVAAFCCQRCGWLCFLFVFCFSLLMSFVKSDIHWHNTMMAFPAGMIFAENKERLEKILHEEYVKWLIVFTIGFLIFYAIPWRIRGIKYNIRGIFMSVIIVTLMLRFKINNRFLTWAGLNLFPLYLYHLVPMRIFAHTSWGGGGNPIMFATLSYLFTAIIVCAYPKFQLRFNFKK